jgi:hypothetical protein
MSNDHVLRPALESRKSRALTAVCVAPGGCVNEAGVV